MGGMDAARFRVMLKALDRTERLILMLTYAEKLSLAEVAMVLDMPERRVEASLGRLRKRCEALLHAAANTRTVAV